MATTILKPKGMTVDKILLNQNIINSKPVSFQEKHYKPKNYFIETDKNTNEYYLKNTTPPALAAKNTEKYKIYSFIIIEQEDYFELMIGEANHHIIAHNAPFVSAAGDIYVSCESEKIFKVNDQSGGYYIPNHDPLSAEKRQSAKKVMEVAGLPMHLFEPFESVNSFVKPEPLIFSNKLQIPIKNNPIQEKTDIESCYTKFLY